MTTIQLAYDKSIKKLRKDGIDIQFEPDPSKCQRVRLDLTYGGHTTDKQQKKKNKDEPWKKASKKELDDLLDQAIKICPFTYVNSFFIEMDDDDVTLFKTAFYSVRVLGHN